MEQKPKNIVLEVQNGIIDINFLFNKLDDRVKKIIAQERKEDGKTRTQ